MQIYITMNVLVMTKEGKEVEEAHLQVTVYNTHVHSQTYTDGNSYAYIASLMLYSVAMIAFDLGPNVV